MNLATTIALRFRRGRQQNGFVSFISFASTFGIGLGCFVLIVLLSVMNGFERELKERILSFIPHGEIYSLDNQGIKQWPEFAVTLSQIEGVQTVTPYTKITGMLQFRGTLKAIEVTGIDIAANANDPMLSRVNQSTWQQVHTQDNTIVLGQGLMHMLGIKEGDNVDLLVPNVTNDMRFKPPKSVRLKVVGALVIGGEMDNHIGLTSLPTASQAAGIISGAQGLRFRFDDPFTASRLIREIGYEFPQAVYISDWMRTQGHLYQDIQLVRLMVYIALILVIAVACFNIVSTMVMAVKEKQRNIAILKTMGANSRLIRRIFLLQGVFNGVLGTVIGTSLALLVAPNLSAIITWLENTLGVKVMSGDVYFIDFLPSQLELLDVLATVAIALILTVVASIYPAIRAAKLSPAQHLN